jgi:ribosomal protein L37AE/L43A
MVCEQCGHPNEEHRLVTSSLFYCNQCKNVEVEASFSQEGGSDPSKSEEALTDLYNAFRK